MLTLEQLIKLGENINVDIFDGLRLPDGSPLDRLTLINTIIMKCGLNVPMYADPSVMASAITVWSAKNQYTFVHVGKIMSADYSPIENKNYISEHEIIHGRNFTDNTQTTTNKSEQSDNFNASSVQSSKSNKHTGTDTTTDTMETSAYNETDYQDKDKTTTELEHGEIISENGSGSSSAGGRQSKTTDGTGASDKTVREDETTKETAHEHGNIGVSTNFDLQRGEYDLIAGYRPYDFIAGLFENELTLYIY